MAAKNNRPVQTVPPLEEMEENINRRLIGVDRPVVEYITASHNNLYEFETQVRLAISRGFQPAGGIAIDGSGCFYQAMVKRG
jgi:hypothetical protein